VLPAYDPRDTSMTCRKYRSCRHYQPALYQEHHHQKAKLTVWSCVKTRRPHASPSCIVTGRGNPNWLLPTRLAPANRSPTHSWIQQVADGTPFGICVEYSRACALEVKFSRRCAIQIDVYLYLYLAVVVTPALG